MPLAHECMSNSNYSCTACGNITSKWAGRCEACGEWNSISEDTGLSQGPTKTSLGRSRGLFIPLNNLKSTDKPLQRIKCDLDELDRVLGGGLVPSSAILVGGDPGIGKSTLLLQAAAKFAINGLKTLYLSGEEASSQVKLRAKRLELEESPIHLGSDTNLRNILTTLEKEKPDLAIIDSIQTIWSDKVESAPGTVSQVRAAAHELTSFAKRSNTSIVLVGHVTKEGQIAGPRVVEHMVDTVLYFEGERGNQFRILRSVKNRFGPADEIGVFEMTGLGLQQVVNPSALFLSSRGAPSAGSCVFAGIEGTRPLLVEIQALVSPTPLSQPRRSVIGWDSNRLAMILAVLEARCEIQFSGLDVYLNVAGGLKISEPAADLAVAAALISARENIIIPESYVFFGEVSLSGAIRSVGKMENRLKEAEKLGFKQAEGPKNIQSVEDSNLEVFENLDLLSFVNKLVDDTKKQTLGT